jgi:pyrroline-5-carboxylate reductase
MDITFIGGGNMASALAGGLAAKGFAARGMKIVEVLPDARRRLADSLGVATFEAPAPAAPYGDVVVLAMAAADARGGARRGATPQGRAGALDRRRHPPRGSRPLARRLRPPRALHAEHPGLIGLGVTSARGPRCAGANGRTRKPCSAGRGGSGRRRGAPRPVTAVSGSGPACVLPDRGAERAAREVGLDAAAARRLALGTFRGAAELAARSSEPPATLRERVTSKGGTTERALASMRADKLDEAIVRAVRAANERAKALGDELGKD